jgi:hypothetical protein
LMKNSERVCVYSYEGVSDVPLAEGGTILYWINELIVPYG